MKLGAPRKPILTILRLWQDLLTRAGMLFRVAPLTGDTADLPAGVRDAITEDTRGRLRAHQVNAILQVSPVLMMVNAVNALLVLSVLHVVGALTSLIIAWSVLVLVVAGWGLRQAVRKRRHTPPRSTSRRTIRRVVRSAGLFGVVWMVPGLLFVPEIDGFALGFCMAVVTGMIAGGAYALYPVPAAAAAFMAPVTTGVVAGLAVSHGWLALIAAMVALMFLAVFVAGTRRHADLFVSEYLLRLALERRAGLIEDIMEDRRLEAQVGAARDARASGAALDVAGGLVGGLAHCFNNLFATIRGNAELLICERSADQSLVEPIVEATDAGARRIEQLLMITRKRTLRPAEVDLGELVRDLAPSLGARPAGAGEPRVVTRDNLPPVSVDRSAMATCLAVLVADAQRAAAGGAPVALVVQAPARRRSVVQVEISASGWQVSDALLRRAGDPVGAVSSVDPSRVLDFAYVLAFARQSSGSLEVARDAQGHTRVILSMPAMLARQPTTLR